MFFGDNVSYKARNLISSVEGGVSGLGVLMRYTPLEDVLVTYTPILHGCKHLHTHNE